jgi:anti-sigma regulatory factor (Ser/Thr protein kinase)
MTAAVCGTTRPAPSELRTGLTLAALPTAVPCARLHALSVAIEWGLAEAAKDVELVVSELVTNSVNAYGRLTAPGVPVTDLSMTSDGSQIMISVWDACDDLPEPHRAGAGDDCGRGLMMVEAYSESWGFYPDASRGGKVVWALLPAAATQPGPQQ